MKRFLLLLLPLIALAGLSCNSSGGGTDDTPEPYIRSISTAYEGKVVAGEPVTLNGMNFSPVASENKVVYGVGLDATSLRVSESSENHVVFTAPEISGTQLKVRVSTNGKESNPVVLEYTTPSVDPGPGPGPDDEDDNWSDEPTISLPGAQTLVIREGVEWTSFHGVWEGQVRNINIVRTTLNGHNHIGIYFNYSHTGLDNLDEKCEYLDAIAGTNGPMACCQFVRVDGEVKHSPTDSDYWIANCAITIDGDVVDIVQVTDNYAAKRLPNSTVGCAGPLLVWKGKIQSYPEETTADFLKKTHPRTAIGLSKDGKTIIQVAVDGRWTSSNTDKRAIGMSTPLLSKLMLELGCYKAMNFDGGGGTAMWVYGQGDGGIVNHPTDNSDWDHPQASLRATGNAVYITSDLK